MTSEKGMGSVPSARVRNSSCLVDNKMIIVFGGNAKGALDDLYALNVGK